MAQVTLWGSHEFARMLFSREVEPPNAYYLALIHTGSEPDPFISGMELDEPEVESYVRVEIPNDESHWASNLDTVFNNAVEIRFPVAAEDWGGISYWALCNAEEEGYIYLYGSFTSELYIAAGDSLVVDSQALQLEFSEIYEEISDG